MDDYLLQFSNVSTFSETSENVHNLSFTVTEGENVVFFGPEGSGIGSIFSLILDIELEFDGNIYYKSQSVKDFNYTQRLHFRKGIGYLQEQFGLISNMSVEENISLPLQYHSEKTRVQVKRYVAGFIEELNLDHCKKLRPIDLSLSEKLKTAYARSITLDPELLLVEKIFEGQSLLNIKVFNDHLLRRSLFPDKSVLYVTYEPQKYLDNSDKFIMLFNGRKVFEGTSEEYRSTSNPYVVQYRNISTTGPMAIL